MSASVGTNPRAPSFLLPGVSGLILTMVRTLHEGFRELFPPVEKPIEIYKTQQTRLKASRQGR